MRLLTECAPRTAVMAGLAFLSMAALPGDAAADAREEIRRYVEQHVGETGFNGTLLVKRDGRVLYRGAFGVAERAFATPATNETRYPIASITKLFTSTLILQLADSGQLALDAPVKTYLPGYPGGGADTVTVRQLLNHTSGIAQFDTVASYQEAFSAGIPSYQRPLSSAALLSLCCSGPLARKPGETFEYNNADYFVLGRVIEQLTGENFEAVLRKKIIEPLGLRDTGMLRWDAPLARLATTYFLRDDTGALIRDMPIYWENWYAAGGMYSTAANLSVFADALYGGRLIKAASLQDLLRPGFDDYGLGLWSYEVRRSGATHSVAKRPGRIMGANSVLYRLLDERVSIIILANTNAADLDVFAQKIADCVIADLAVSRPGR